MNIKKYVIGLALITSNLWAVGTPRTVSVTAVGMVLNNSSEPAQSRQRSLIEAQRMAVEKAIGTTVKAHALVDKSILVESTINTQTKGRIRQFAILKQWVDGIWMKTTIKADVDLADPVEDQRSLREQISHLSPSKMFGVLAFVNRSTPSEYELRQALQDPLPPIQAFYAKLKGQLSKTVPDALLMESVSTQLGLDIDHATMDELENLFLGQRPN